MLKPSARRLRVRPPLETSRLSVNQASAEAYALAEELLVLERRRQELGGSDLFRLVQREESVLDAGMKLAEAEAKSFKARAVWLGAIASGAE